jgi:hypothetical protein
MTARRNRQKPPARGIPRKRVPGGSRLRSVSIEMVVENLSETEQEDEDTEKE